MTVQRVDPGALTSQAAEMKGRNWHNRAEEAVAPPDAVPSTTDAIANLNDNARSLKEFEEWARIENQRIAEMLEIAAQAYQEVDHEYGNALDSPERVAAIDAIVVPAPQTPAPEIPAATATPRLLDASAYSDVIKTQAALTAPDAGASLKTAMLRWVAASNRVENNRPKPPAGDWEGEAADAAYARMSAFGNWLTQLSEAWHDLGEAASKILSAHENAKNAHDPIYQEYMRLDERRAQLAGMTVHPGGVRAQQEIARIVARMEELQKQSEEVRREYASEATFPPVRPADPPVKRGDGVTPAGGRGGGGDQPTGDTATMTQRMGESMGTGRQQGAGQAGASGGGSPSSGGTPSTAGDSGGNTGGSEGAGSPAPKHAGDPSLRPAAAGGGSGGSAGAGGGSGGGPGAASAPLSPAVTAETVAPAPPVPVAASAAPAPAAASGMAGGVGGMAPMHGAAGAQQGKEKRRDPRTAPDEDLYVEDRPWTEGVVGNRRRRDVQDGRQRAFDDDQDDDE